MRTIRIITLQEPWASLIGEGIKIIETRSWPCYQYGELYIHAGMSKIPRNDTRRNTMAKWLKRPMHYGTIFAKCQLVDCVPITAEFSSAVKENDPDCFLCGDYSNGRYAWILKDIEYIDPIKSKGKLGIWYMDIE